ncbi:MAG TPA: M3 family metallopeptidase [Acidobacteriota bacterium]|nr:M3 family metallopeptidase [Acidobacteriota bacterium]
MKLLLLLVIFALGIQIVIAEEFQPFTPEEAPKYHFDLKKYFYVDEAAYQKDMAEAKQIADEVQTYKGKVTASGPNLFVLAQKLERFGLLTQKMYIYRYLSYAIDTKMEPAYSAADQELSALGAKVAFVDTELRKISNQDLDRLVAAEPKLAPYRFYLEQNTRLKPYTLSADQEQLVAELSPNLYTWESQLFQRLIDRTKFEDITTKSGTYNVYRDRQVLNKDPDREIRKKAMTTLYDQYSMSADLYGFTLIKLANAVNNESTVRGYKDAFDASLFGNYLTKDQADSFFKAVSDYAPLSQRYVNLRKQRIKAISGIDPVEPWDAEVVPPNYKRPQFTIDQTRDVIEKALAFHGQAYSTDLANLLDPANGRLDIVTGQNRVPGAFAWGYYGSPFVFYSFGFHGYLDDVLTLAHEGGHVVHYDLISQNKILTPYANGPAYFTESFAMLNEFTTANYLYEKATNKDDKIYYLEQLLSVMMRRFFDITMRSEFEYRVYEKIKSGEITEPDQIHQVWKDEGLRYIGDDYQKYDFLKYNWSFTPHFFGSPRYYINYLFANLMAISYFQRHLSDPQFDKQYVDLMAHGFPDTPTNLLQKYLKLNPFDPATVKESMKVFEAKLSELEALYKQ